MPITRTTMDIMKGMLNACVHHDSAVQRSLNGQQSLHLGITKIMMQNVLHKTLGHTLRKSKLCMKCSGQYKEGEFASLMLNAFYNDKSFSVSDVHR